MNAEAPPQPPRQGRFFRDYGLVILLVMAVIGVYDTCFPHAPQLEGGAPAFALPGLDGETVSLESLRGQVVVLNFWATWCSPCRGEIPEFSRFAQAHPEVAVLGMSVDDMALPELARQAETLGIHYPVLLADDATQAAYDVQTLPTTIVLGTDLQVRDIHVGTMNVRSLERAVELAMEPAPQPQ